MIVVNLFVLGVLVAVSAAQDAPAAAAAQGQDAQKPPVEIVSSNSNVTEDGYNFEYKTSDGSSRQEEAHLITVGEQQGIGIKGSYSYVAPDGLEHQVSYTADDKGYNPTIRVKPHGEQ